jgi:4-aminobutyrate aminotransferase-like enzyme
MNIQHLCPPMIAEAPIRAFVQESFGLEGNWTRLDGERDQNFRIEHRDGTLWTIKICNRHEPQDIIACQALALEHVSRVDPSLPVPRLRRPMNGELFSNYLDETGNAYRVLCLSFLPGEIIGGMPLSPVQLQKIGGLAARLGRALRGFIHPAPAGRELVWDNRLAPRLLGSVDRLRAASRNTAREILVHFRDEVLPRLGGLRSQIIHGDVHPYNALIDSVGEITGIIDFGDLVHGALIQDLANLTADFLESAGDAERIIFNLVKGYCAVTSLEEEELDVLFDLIDVRLVMTPLIAAIRAAGRIPLQGYLSTFGDRCFPVLENLRGQARSHFQNVARRAAAFPPEQAHSFDSDGTLLARRRHVLGKRLQLFYDPPVHMVRGEGVWLYGADGRRYLDCYNNVPHVGHCHPYVAEAIARQARKLNTNTRYVTDEAVAYAERLVATLDPSLSAVLYVNSGSEANDVAWRLAKAWTGKSGGLTMEFAYHGITDAANAFSPSNWQTGLFPPHMRTVPPPDDYRGPFRRGEPDLGIRYAALIDEPIHSLGKSGPGVAAMMVDSAFMSNGMIEAPAGYVRAVCDKVRAAGGLFIADEVQSGFGRMGSAMWGHQHHGIVPDVVTVGKPAGNGHPIGVVMTRPEILDRFTGAASFFSTFGGNNVSCAAGKAVLDVIRDENLIENARKVGAYLKQGLRGLKSRHSLIGDVRGTGLALGVELVRDRISLEPATQETARLLNLIRDEGVLVGSEGKYANILKIRPPIVLTVEQADIAIAATDRAFARL